MFYIIAIIVLLIIVAVLIWYFLYKKSSVTQEQPQPPQPQVSPKAGNGYTVDRSMPYSSFYNQITVDEPGIVETERKLLDMAKAPRPHPQLVFNSNLRRDGNPFVGDLKIKPRQHGVAVPLNASPSDLQIGYFQ